MKTLTALVLFCSVLAFVIGRSSVTRLELAPDVKAQLDKWVDGQMNREKSVPELPPLTEDELLREKNRPGVPELPSKWANKPFTGGAGAVSGWLSDGHHSFMAYRFELGDDVFIADLINAVYTPETGLRDKAEQLKSVVRELINEVDEVNELGWARPELKSKAIALIGEKGV